MFAHIRLSFFVLLCSALSFVCFFLFISSLVQIDAWNAVCLFYKHHLNISLQKKIHMELMLSFDLSMLVSFFYYIMSTIQCSKQNPFIVFHSNEKERKKNIRKFFNEHRIMHIAQSKMYGFRISMASKTRWRILQERKKIVTSKSLKWVSGAQRTKY